MWAADRHRRRSSRSPYVERTDGGSDLCRSALFRNRTVTVATVVGFLTGMPLFGAIAFIPLLVQVTTGGSATSAGQILTPLYLTWVLASIVAARLLLRIGVRAATVVGTAAVFVSFVGAALARRRLVARAALRRHGADGDGARFRDALAAARRAALGVAGGARRGDVAQSVRAHGSAAPSAWRSWAPFWRRASADPHGSRPAALGAGRPRRPQPGTAAAT